MAKPQNVPWGEVTFNRDLSWGGGKEGEGGRGEERAPLFLKKSFSAIEPRSSFPSSPSPPPTYQYFSCVIEKPLVLLRGKASCWEVRDPSCTLNQSGMLHTLFLSNFRSKLMWSVCFTCMNQVQSLKLTQLLLLLTAKKKGFLGEVGEWGST